MNTLANRRSLVRWCVWFTFGNIFLLWVIGLNYLRVLSYLHLPFYFSVQMKIVVITFTTLSYLGQLALFASLPCLIIIPLIYILPRRHFIFTFSAVIAAIIVSLLLTDTIIYDLYRFHFYGIFMEILLGSITNEVLGFSWLECLLAIAIPCAMALIELLYAYWLWHRFILKKTCQGLGKWIVIFCSLSLYTSYLMIIFSSSRTLNFALVDTVRFLPFYNNVLGFLLPIKNGFYAIENNAFTFIRQPSEQSNIPLNYPTTTLQYDAHATPFNLVIIVIDTWRFDQMTRDVTPFIANFAKDAWQFTNHFSGGNSTGPGIFSLFYGLPTNYWAAMATQHRGPVLIDELQRRHYQIGIFSSASLRIPAFHETIFQTINNLIPHAPGNTADSRDVAVTHSFKKFIATAVQHKQPFFSFLFYDAAHSYCDIDPISQPFKPVITQCNRMQLTNAADPMPYLNRYKNALLSVDNQVNQVIASLKAQHLLDNTVILITGDHGEEFNDNHVGFWGHASNFTHYQVQTPLIVHWPGGAPRIFTKLTSHYDIVPTLMTNLLGCYTTPTAYSVGKLLTNDNEQNYLITSSYINIGILEKNRITTIFPTGDFHIDDLNAQPLPYPKLNLAVIPKAMHDMRRFYKDEA